MKKSISCNCQFTQMKGNSNVLSANLMELLPIRIPIHIMFVQVQMADDGWLHCQSLPPWSNHETGKLIKTLGCQHGGVF